MKLTDRMFRLGTETAFEVLAAAKERESRGHKVIHLEIGEPDFDTPSNIVEAGIEALKQGWHHYVPASGILELKEAVAEEISRTRKITVDSAQVVVTPGGKPILFYTILALAQEGDEVIYPNPGFPIYESMIRYVGAKPIPVPLRESLDFRMDVDELTQSISEKTRLIILNSPNNPTGSVLTGDDLSRVAEACQDKNLMVLSDEIYSRILYSGEHDSISNRPGMGEKTIILDGFSKTYAMTGWRLGYGVMPKSLAEQITRLMINSNSCTAAFTQIAGVEALRGNQNGPERMLEIFRRRRDRVVELLNQIDGITCRLPQGAFYAFPNIRETGMSSRQLQVALLEEADVALLSGTAFGKFGEGFLRLSYANSMSQLEEGIARIADFLKSLH